MSVLARLHAALARPVDGAGLAVFRILFGVLLAVGNLRFLLSGWPQKLYGEPTFFFRFAGFRHVPPLDVDSATWAYGGFVVCGVLIALGVLYRPAIVCFTVLFAWVQLADVTNYLNHYWLVLLLAACLCVLPATSCLALDNLLFRRRQRSVPRGAYLLLMFQVGVVYVFAAIAKIGPDWLLYGQPLGVWLPGRSELPVIGTLIAQPIVALLASWCGFLYDASIVPLLLWRRSRPFAYVLVVVFHTLTSLFFSIGMFPVIMAVATTVFFSPSWPRRFFGRWLVAAPSSSTFSSSSSSSSWSKPATLLLVVWCAVHVALPLRCFVIGDDVLWDEVGMRFSWRVMVREKSGSLSYKVTLGPLHNHKVVVVNPHDRLTWRQVNEMIGQPDLILQLAHAIRDDLNENGYGPVEVRADSVVTLNGRRSVRFIDPDVDLASVEDCFFCRPGWILPPPTSPPPDPWRRLRLHRY
ncbi:MAG TPA: HTTM domain-containing protein [Myxococcota bacterium]